MKRQSMGGLARDAALRESGREAGTYLPARRPTQAVGTPGPDELDDWLRHNLVVGDHNRHAWEDLEHPDRIEMTIAAVTAVVISIDAQLADFREGWVPESPDWKRRARRAKATALKRLSELKAMRSGAKQANHAAHQRAQAQTGAKLGALRKILLAFDDFAIDGDTESLLASVDEAKAMMDSAGNDPAWWTLQRKRNGEA